MPTLIIQKNQFCVLVPLMKRQGVANIFHARRVILMMNVYSLVIARESGKVIGMPSPEMKKNITIIINSLESVGMQGISVYD